VLYFVYQCVTRRAEYNQMSYQIVAISKEYDASVSDIIKSVGAEYGAVGEGYGPSDPEVDCMSEHYNEQTIINACLQRLQNGLNDQVFTIEDLTKLLAERDYFESKEARSRLAPEPDLESLCDE